MKETNIVALEIGSSKIKGAVGTIDDNGVLTVQVVDEEPLLDWVRYGMVSNAEEVSAHATRLLDRLEDRSGNKTVQSVYVALGGRSLRTEKRENERQLPHEMEISEEIIEQLMAEAASAGTGSREQIDVVPREFIVDKSKVLKPKGTLGRSIIMRSNVITCRPQLKRNLIHLIQEKLGLEVLDFKVRQIAQADFVLSTDEKRLGCMLVDCGAETTTVSIYKSGALQYLQTLPMGSRNITRDLTSLNLLEEQAEAIKINFDAANPAVISKLVPANIGIEQIGLCISERAGEIIANIREQIKLAQYKAKDLPSGIILVGRGALLNGFSSQLASATEMRVRVGGISASANDVRLADPRISMSNSVDVISVLYAASRRNPIECMIEPYIAPPVQPAPKPQPAPKQPEPAPEPEPEPEVDREPQGGRPRQPEKTGRLAGWFANVGKKLTEMVDEGMDEDEEVLKDDKD